MYLQYVAILGANTAPYVSLFEREGRSVNATDIRLTPYNYTNPAITIDTVVQSIFKLQADSVAIDRARYLPERD